MNLCICCDWFLLDRSIFKSGNNRRSVNLVTLPLQTWFIRFDLMRISIFSKCGSGSSVLMTENWTFLQLDQKLQFTMPLASIKDAQATREAFSPQKRTSSSSKHESFYFLFLWVIMSSWIRIRIQQLELIQNDYCRIQILLFNWTRILLWILHKFVLIFLKQILPLYSCLVIVLGCAFWREIGNLFRGIFFDTKE